MNAITPPPPKALRSGLSDHVKRIWSFLDRRTRWQLLPLFIAMGVIAALETLGVGMLFTWLQMITNPALPLPNWFSRLPLLAGLDHARLIPLGGLALALFFLFKNATLFLLGYFQSAFAYRKHALFTAGLFATYLEGGYVFLSSRNSAEIQRNLTESAIQVFVNGLLQLLNLLLEMLVILALLGFLLSLEPLLTVAMGGFLGGLIVAYQLVLGPRLVRWGVVVNDRSQMVLQNVREAVGAIKDIKILQCEEHFVGNFRRLLLNTARYRSFQSLSTFAPRLYVETLMVLAILAAVVVLSQRHPGDLLAVVGVFGAAAIRLMPSANRLLNLHSTIKSGVAAVAALHTDWSTITGARQSRVAPPSVVPRIESLRLTKVGYTYPGRDKPALSAIDLDLRWGQTVALVGRSGAGKTTLADVVLGLLEPQSGQVQINGQADPQAVQSLRLRVGFVPQSIFILDDSLRRNIAFGVQDGDINTDRLASALRLAELDDIVAALPQGLDTRLGEGGSRLSGGQRQRVGLARAFYHDPDLLVLDEATSALDNETEHKISRALENVRANKALLIIAHRLSTVRHCHTIILMDQGVIVDAGSFDALCQRQPDFRRMVELGRLDDPAPAS
ncbi:MAG: ATP-binding cassette subfamily C [Rhodospirillaceae bacterium]|nr:MAG: ATP-binding cassette subfamily C [Rhodospirillaceae bacterium]TNC97413.1 MAG: ATP-binding cassette, subfamily C, bacterial [Stygiobacter sp.]